MKRFLQHLVDVGSLSGSALFIGGGIYFDNIIAGTHIIIRLGEYGLFFLPAALLALFSPATFRITATYQLLTAAYQRLLALKRNGRIIAATLVIGITSILQLSGIIQKYLSFKMGRDLAIEAQACAHWFFSSHKGDVHYLSDHFKPFLYIFSPLCANFDPAIVLIIIQTSFWTAGAIAVYLLARSCRWSFPSSLVISFIYLVFPGNVTTAYYDPNLLTLAMGFLPWMLLAWRKDRFASFCLLCLCYIGLKENAPLTIMGFSALFLSRRQYVKGFIIGCAGFVSFMVVMQVVFPLFTAGHGTVYFEKYYGHIGADASEFVLTSLTRPWYVISTLITWPKLFYLFRLCAPFLFIHFIRPVFLIPIAPAIALNVLSNWDRMVSMDFNYESEIYPYLFASMVILAKDQIAINRLSCLLRRVRLLALNAPIKRKIIIRATILILLVTLYSGMTPLFHSSFYRSQPEQVHIRMMLKKLVHETDIVAASEKLPPLLSHLQYIYYLDEWHKANKVVIAYPDFDRFWQFSFEKIEGEIIPLIEKDFILTYRDPKYPTFRIWERKIKLSTPSTNGRPRSFRVHH